MMARKCLAMYGLHGLPLRLSALTNDSSIITVSSYGVKLQETLSGLDRLQHWAYTYTFVAFSTLLYNTILYCTILYYTIPYCTIFHYTIYTILYYTIHKQICCFQLGGIKAQSVSHTCLKGFRVCLCDPGRLPALQQGFDHIVLLLGP